jgi:hypothetical protein
LQHGYGKEKWSSGGVIRVNIEKAKSRARESTHGPTVLGIKETGLII